MNKGGTLLSWKMERKELSPQVLGLSFTGLSFHAEPAPIQSPLKTNPAPSFQLWQEATFTLTAPDPTCVTAPGLCSIVPWHLYSNGSQKAQSSQETMNSPSSQFRKDGPS